MALESGDPTHCPRGRLVLLYLMGGEILGASEIVGQCVGAGAHGKASKGASVALTESQRGLGLQRD